MAETYDRFLSRVRRTIELPRRIGDALPLGLRGVGDADVHCALLDFALRLGVRSEKTEIDEERGQLAAPGVPNRLNRNRRGQRLLAELRFKVLLRLHGCRLVMKVADDSAPERLLGFERMKPARRNRLLLLFDLGGRHIGE